MTCVVREVRASSSMGFGVQLPLRALQDMMHTMHTVMMWMMVHCGCWLARLMMVRGRSRCRVRIMRPLGCNSFPHEMFLDLFFGLSFLFALFFLHRCFLLLEYHHNLSFCQRLPARIYLRRKSL